MDLPLRDFTNDVWVYDEYRLARETDFEIAELKGWRVAIHKFEGVVQPVCYNGELVFAMPHYWIDTTAAMNLFIELDHAAIHQPTPSLNNQWRINCLYTYAGVTKEYWFFANTLPEAVCDAWLSIKKWDKNDNGYT